MLKNAIGASLLIFLVTAAASAGVTVQSPLPASAVGSPVHFVASASSSFLVTAMRIYVDSASVYSTAGNALDVFVPVAIGTHAVVVQAWDSSGAVFKFPETVTVTGGLSVAAPANGSLVGSPFAVVANAAAARPVSAMVIYLDGNNVFAAGGASVNTVVSASPGRHSLVVQAWDTSGAIYKQELAVTVDSGIPANAITRSAIQAMPGWESCTVCAGVNANCPTAGFSMIQH